MAPVLLLSGLYPSLRISVQLKHPQKQLRTSGKSFSLLSFMVTFQTVSLLWRQRLLLHANARTSINRLTAARWFTISGLISEPVQGKFVTHSSTISRIWWALMTSPSSKPVRRPDAHHSKDSSQQHPYTVLFKGGKKTGGKLPGDKSVNILPPPPPPTPHREDLVSKKDLQDLAKSTRCSPWK